MGSAEQGARFWCAAGARLALVADRVKIAMSATCRHRPRHPGAGHTLGRLRRDAAAVLVAGADRAQAARLGRSCSCLRPARPGSQTAAGETRYIPCAADGHRSVTFTEHAPTCSVCPEVVEAREISCPLVTCSKILA